MMSDARRSQSERFKETASKVEPDQSHEVLDRVMGKLDLSKKAEARHASDCATHNAPAFAAGACDCKS